MERETAKEAGNGEGEKKKREERERENLGNSFCIRRRGADLHLLLLLLVSLLLLLPSCRLGERGDRRLRVTRLPILRAYSIKKRKESEKEREGG